MPGQWPSDGSRKLICGPPHSMRDAEPQGHHILLHKLYTVRLKKIAIYIILIGTV